MPELSTLQRLRLEYIPKIPAVLQDLLLAEFVQGTSVDTLLKSQFPKLSISPELRVQVGDKRAIGPKRVGCVLSGGQAAGGHNVIIGLFDALKALNPLNRLFGFLDGPQGIVKNSHIELTAEKLASYRNQGGFDLLGSGRTKVDSPEQFEAALQAVLSLDLDGLVIIGGDDSNTNAAYLAEFFLQKNCKTAVVGIPKTIDGDLQSKDIELSFGFDTATRIYSESIGNIARDALSAKKYYYFVKLMGRSASHITLECALKTQPNLALIGEEIASKNQSLPDVVNTIVDLIMERSKLNKNYGVILIPEGLIEFVADVKVLISELNQSKDMSSAKLSEKAKACLEILPEKMQKQLLSERDPHGNVEVSKIETERLLIDLVTKELEKRKSAGYYAGGFSPQPIFCGYEGRCGLPSQFDSDYSYSLGYLAALLIKEQKTGYIAAFTQLAQSVDKWIPLAVPLIHLLHLEMRKGEKRAVVRKTLVNLEGKLFTYFSALKEKWRTTDSYLQPGPIQFFGPAEIVELRPLTLQLRDKV